VAGVDDGLFGQGQEPCGDAHHELVGIAAGKVGPSDGFGEKGVIGEDKCVFGAVEAYSAWGVAWCVDDTEGQIGEFEVPGVGQEYFGRGGGKLCAGEDREVRGGIGEHLGVEFVDGERHFAVFGAEHLDADNVVSMAVCEDCDDGFEGVVLEEIEQGLRLHAGVDDEAFGCVCVSAQDVAVCLEVSEYEAVDFHVFLLYGVRRVSETAMRVNRLFCIDRGERFCYFKRPEKTGVRGVSSLSDCSNTCGLSGLE